MTTTNDPSVIPSTGTGSTVPAAAGSRGTESSQSPKPATAKPLPKQSSPQAKPAAVKRVRNSRTGKPTKAKKPMAKTSVKKSTDVNKSEEIRTVAKAMKAKGMKPRPSLIVSELKAKGVKVAPAQVSGVLKRMGFRPLRRRSKAKPAAGAAAAPKSAPGKHPVKTAGQSAVLSVDDLLAAKKMAGSLGGTEKAIAALQALKRFED